jgi:hypothetical protein
MREGVGWEMWLERTVVGGQGADVVVNVVGQEGIEVVVRVGVAGEGGAEGCDVGGFVGCGVRTERGRWSGEERGLKAVLWLVIDGWYRVGL